MTYRNDTLMAQLEQMKRKADWFSPPHRSNYHFGYDLGRSDGDYSGLGIVITEKLAQTKTDRRTWRERFFSRQWQPWRATKKVPGQSVFYSDRRRIFTCERGADELRKGTVG